MSTPMITKQERGKNYFKKIVLLIIDTLDTKIVLSRQSSKEKKKNIYITDNLTYGDVLHTTTGSLTRILGQNVNRFESSHIYTLELVCDSVRKN